MLHRENPMTKLKVRRWLLGVLLGALALVCAIVLAPFAVAVTWAAILAYTSWPAYRFVRKVCHQRHTLAALGMTLLVALILIVPLCWLAFRLEDELAAVYQIMISARAGDLHPPLDFLRAIPALEDTIRHASDRIAADPLLIRQLLIGWAQRSHAELLGIVGDMGRDLAILFLTIVTVFFFYRDGDGLVAQATQVLNRFFGDRLDRYLRAAGRMTRAVIYGLLITAFVQGSVGGLGYAVFGIRAPVLLGVLTALASIVPIVGTLLVWGPVGLWLMATGHLWPGLGLLAWGSLLVQPASNLIQPLLISNVTRIPFLLVMFGVLGGLTAFGLLGVFIGPVALATATAVWREWLEERADPVSAPV
jgi:predicted PurR-regulated permease PerM